MGDYLGLFGLAFVIWMIFVLRKEDKQIRKNSKDAAKNIFWKLFN